MQTSTTAIRSAVLSLITVTAMTSTAASAFQDARPPYENLGVAKQFVQSVSFRVQGLIGRCGGDHGDRSGGWGDDQGRRGDSGGSSGFPGFPSHGRHFPFMAPEGLDTDAAAPSSDYASDDTLENDNLANLALQVMGKELFELGQLVDQATMNYNSPAFWGYWHQACNQTAQLIVGNQGAKVAASLPLQGLVSAIDFAPNDQELQAVRQQLWCP